MRYLFMFFNSFWHFSSQMDFFSKWENGEVILTSWIMNLLTTWTLPWRLLKSFEIIGGGKSIMAEIFLGYTLIHHLDTMKPCNLLDELQMHIFEASTLTCTFSFFEISFSNLKCDHLWLWIFLGYHQHTPQHYHGFISWNILTISLW